MHGQVRRAGLGEGLEEAERLDDHEVHVEREPGHAVQRLDDQGSEREVRHELAVHDVHMEEVGARALDARDLLRELREVGREDGGADAPEPRLRPRPSEIRGGHRAGHGW